MSLPNVTGATASVGIVDQLFGLANAGILGKAAVEVAKINNANASAEQARAAAAARDVRASKDKQAFMISGLVLAGLIALVLIKRKG